jgi:hypothetical protein
MAICSVTPRPFFHGERSTAEAATSSTRRWAA